MSHPSQYFERIRRLQARGAARRRDAARPAPLPVSPPAVTPTPAPRQPTPAAPAQSVGGPNAPRPAAEALPDDRPTPRPAGHALFSQVMRSHDRMGTRHL